MDHTCLVPANSRGGTVLLHQGYRYRRRNKTNHEVYWECTITGCGAFVHSNVFDDDDLIISKYFIYGNHLMTFVKNFVLVMTEKIFSRLLQEKLLLRGILL
jgi:hypothetical protein